MPASEIMPSLGIKLRNLRGVDLQPRSTLPATTSTYLPQHSNASGMPMRISSPFLSQYPSKDIIIDAWRTEVANEQLQQLPNPLKRKHRDPLMSINLNMSTGQKKRRTGNDKDQDKQNHGRRADGDSSSHSEVRRSSRTRSQQPSTSGHSYTEDGTADKSIVAVVPSNSTYIAALQSSAADSSISLPSKKSSRASSPVKKKADLRLGQTELDYKGSVQNFQSELPEDVHTLCDALESICHGIGVVPLEVGDLFNRKEKLHPHMAKPHNERRNYDALFYEFRVIESCLQRSLDCLRREKHEPAWNEEVHRPVLDLAIHDVSQKRISVDNVTLAQISSDFVPESAFDTRLSMQSKMVDYTINLVLPEENNSIIHRFLASLPYAQRSLNQTVYTALRERPIAVSIETKVENPSDPITQLAIWASAWHKRVRRIIGRARVITLPLITISKDNWKISFFCDFGERVEIWDLPTAIGHTKTVIGVYMLLAAIRAVCDWVEAIYRPWYQTTVWPEIEKITQANAGP